jgi:hypothetical protein
MRLRTESMGEVTSIMHKHDGFKPLTTFPFPPSRNFHNSRVAVVSSSPSCMGVLGHLSIWPTSRLVPSPRLNNLSDSLVIPSTRQGLPGNISPIAHSSPWQWVPRPPKPCNSGIVTPRLAMQSTTELAFLHEPTLE